jgi:hypothetical protein
MFGSEIKHTGTGSTAPTKGIIPVIQTQNYVFEVRVQIIPRISHRQAVAEQYVLQNTTVRLSCLASELYLVLLPACIAF